MYKSRIVHLNNELSIYLSIPTFSLFFFIEFIFMLILNLSGFQCSQAFNPSVSVSCNVTLYPEEGSQFFPAVPHLFPLSAEKHSSFSLQNQNDIVNKYIYLGPADQYHPLTEPVYRPRTDQINNINL